VKELRNMLEPTVLLAQGDSIAPDQLGFPVSRLDDDGPNESVSGHDAPAAGARSIARIADVEQRLVAQTLERTDWNISKSAKLLGLSRDMLRYRIEKYGSARPE